MDPATIFAAAQAGMQLANYALQAAEALQNGDEKAAEAYMQQARDHFARSRDAWDRAPGPG